MTRRSPDHRERAYAPRGLRREAAADYIGMSATKFDAMVRDGRMPKPKRVDGCVVWDRYRLDSAFDALPGDDAEVDTWADVTGWPMAVDGVETFDAAPARRRRVK